MTDVLSLVKSGGAFSNPMAGTVAQFQTQGAQMNFSLDGISTLFDGLVLSQVPTAGLSINLLGTNVVIPDGVTLATNPIDSIKTLISDTLESFNGLKEHGDKVVDPNGNPDTPNVTNILSMNNAKGVDAKCLVVTALLGALLMGDQLKAAWDGLLEQIKALFADLANADNYINAAQALVNQISADITNAILDDISAFEQQVLEITQKAVAQLLEAAFGDECAKKLINVLGSTELKAQQKLSEKANAAKDAVSVKVGEFIPPDLKTLL